MSKKAARRAHGAWGAGGADPKEKKARTQEPGVPAVATPMEPVLTKNQIKGIAAGAGLVAVGFFVLAQADPAGKNWAGHLCPFLILCGYAVIGIALWKRNK